MRIFNKKMAMVLSIVMISGCSGDNEGDGLPFSGQSSSAPGHAGSASSTRSEATSTQSSSIANSSISSEQFSSASAISSSTSTSVSSVGNPDISACNDGIDNDGDGYTDWQYDLGCANAEDDDEQAAPRSEESGWTTYDTSEDSKVVFVSASTGNDNNDGLSPDTPVATLTKAAALVRDGYNDFMLLKRGDRWRDEELGRFKSGRDASHPLVIASYGESTQRPRIEVNTHFINHNGKERSFVSLLGLNIISFPKIPGDPAYDGSTGGGLRYVGGGSGLLIEDSHFTYGELVFQSYGGLNYDGIEVRRSIIEKSYHVNTCNQSSKYRPSGIYASHVHNLTIEENLLDHNGWNEDVETACSSMYNHNLYLNAHGLIIKNNLITRASSMGIKMRSDETYGATDIHILDNVFTEGEIGISIGGNNHEPHRFRDVSIKGNVFSQIGYTMPSGRTLSWLIDVQDNETTTISDNYLLHHATWSTNPYGVQLSSSTLVDINVTNNLFYGLKSRSLQAKVEGSWGNLSVTDNTFVDMEHGGNLIEHYNGSLSDVEYSGNRYASMNSTFIWTKNTEELDDDKGLAVSFEQWRSTAENNATQFTPNYVDPQRTIGSYAATLGLSASTPAFINEARKQNRLTWRTPYTAQAVKGYITDGFKQP